jgi:hypothetical protein
MEGATIRPALRGAKVKFKGGGAGVLADEGRRSLHSLQIYIIENKISLFLGGALCCRRPIGHAACNIRAASVRSAATPG